MLLKTLHTVATWVIKKFKQIALFTFISLYLTVGLVYQDGQKECYN